MLLAVEDKKKLAGPAIWGGLSVFVSLIAFIVLSIAPLGRRLDKRKAVDVSGARWSAWLAATFAIAAAAIIGAAFAATAEASEILVIFGLVPWAIYGALAGLLAGLFGIAAIVFTVRTRRVRSLPIGTLTGFMLTGIAALGLCTFFLYWGLSPF